jgi:propionyl-CoA carboxylase beta chain
MFKTHRCRDLGIDKQVFLGGGVVTGHCTVDGRIVHVFAQDFTVLGGSLSETFAEKICRIMDLAMKNGAPVVANTESGKSSLFIISIASDFSLTSKASMAVCLRNAH